MPSQSMVLVIMCVSCQLCTLFIFTKLYQEEAPYQNHHQIRVRRRLPNITGSCARGAKPIGVFGMVYQRLPLCRSGWDPATGGHYQAPPPGNKDGYRMLLDVLTVVGYEMIPIYFALGIGLIVFGLCE